ncbi:GHKL domain-containing protein [Paenibacillus sp. sgz5001063]|uniref:GHKL domain-containing protein n=1 Tax=Paenibacillus sp. sgz5001063 TaxID=3242474 RepID=UPI0036D2578D
MIQYHLPIIICVILVMCFQINFFFNSVFDKSTRKPNRIGYFIIYSILNYLYLVVQMSAYLSSLVALLMIFTIAHSYKVEIKNKVIFTVLYGVLVTMTNMISLYIFASLDSIDFTTLDSSNENGRLIFTKTILLSCMIMFAVIQIIRLIAKRRSFSVHYRYYLLFLFVPLISMYQVHVLTTYSEKNIYYFIAIIGFLLLNVMVIYLFDNIVDKFQLLHEKAQLQDQMDYQDANYEKTVHSFKSIKRIIHDTNQQFLYIEECIKRNDSAAALEHIKVTQNKVEEAYQRVNTGNLAIDALVTNTLNIGQANGIRIDMKLQLYSQDVHIDRYDLCVVLGNMLDNAIEASKKIKLAEDRYVRIKIHSNENAIFIQIVNHMENEVVQLRSQKSSPEYHGIGLTNIARICEKYGGNMTIEAEHKVFNNMVVLPFHTNNP